MQMPPLPDAIICHPVGTLKKHSCYEQAKNGDLQAALAVARDVITEDVVANLRSIKADAILGVLGMEERGLNMISSACAMRLAKAMDLRLCLGVYKKAGAIRTQLHGLERVFARPIFAGKVVGNRRLVLLDDTLTQGGTIAALAEHVQGQGAQVAAIVAITGKQYSAQLALSVTTLKLLREQLGHWEQDFIRMTGRSFQHMTESEGRYLRRQSIQ